MNFNICFPKYDHPTLGNTIPEGLILVCQNNYDNSTSSRLYTVLNSSLEFCEDIVEASEWDYFVNTDAPAKWARLIFH